MNEDTHRDALDRGLLRYCPVCDGFEASHQSIGVIGADTHGVAEALFLRTFSDRITLLAHQSTELDDSDRESLSHAGIVVASSTLDRLDFSGDQVVVHLIDDTELRFDTIYPALGSDTNNALARQLDVELSDDRCIVVDTKQRASMEGVYAAGDIVMALDQISVAMGHAAVAATAMHNDLRNRDGQTPQRKAIIEMHADRRWREAQMGSCGPHAAIPPTLFHAGAEGSARICDSFERKPAI